MGGDNTRLTYIMTTLLTTTTAAVGRYCYRQFQILLFEMQVFPRLSLLDFIYPSTRAIRFYCRIAFVLHCCGNAYAYVHGYDVYTYINIRLRPRERNDSPRRTKSSSARHEIAIPHEIVFLEYPYAHVSARLESHARNCDRGGAYTIVIRKYRNRFPTISNAIQLAVMYTRRIIINHRFQYRGCIYIRTYTHTHIHEYDVYL